MKLHFEPDLDYQKLAIESVADLFRGQEINRTEFTVTRRALAERTGQGSLDLGAFIGSQGELGLIESELGIGNRLTLLDDEIIGNLKDIQLRNGLARSTALTSGDFTVEMETGTGKTYVYLRTIFELNRRYGFTKFVIVVPSVAIKEGVYKTLQITEEHFRGLYSGQPFDYFLYDSAKLVVQDGDDLQEVTKRAVYADCRIGEIRVAKNSQLLEVKLPDGERFLSLGEAIGDVDADAMKRLMIRRTIQEHLEKEKRLAPLGIKVLTLFFIDAVEHYRSYDDDGNPVKGKYARIFEEEYPHPIGWLNAFDLVFGLALVAVSEEIIFRQYIRQAFQPYLGNGIFALLTTSVLFGAYHWWAGLGNVLLATTVGIFLMLMMRRSGALWPVVLTHYLVDLFVFAQ
jgi:restriction endonuclease